MKPKSLLTDQYCLCGLCDLCGSFIVRRAPKGSVLVFVAVLLPCLLGIMALAVDIGSLYSARSHLQAVADAAALAGASGLMDLQGDPVVLATTSVTKNDATLAPVVKVGLWNPNDRDVVDSPGGTSPNAVKVTVTKDVQFALAGILHFSSSTVSASAVAMVGARDIVLTLDLSGSMCFDSQLYHLSRLGKVQVETALENIWHDFNEPFPAMPRDLVIAPATPVEQILAALGVSGVPYPDNWGDNWQGFTGWDAYITYVKQLGYGYRDHYGYLTLMNYLQEKQRGDDKTPDLAKVREQPIHAMKEAVRVFRDFMEEPKTDDRLGLAVYTYSEDQGGLLEKRLTYDYDEISDTVDRRQAAHYFGNTNIAGGMKAAREELRDNGRPAALCVMVLLTDGQANYFEGAYYPEDPNPAKEAAKAEAHLAADNGIPIITISLGADADTDLMQQIADITGGFHFIVPGGSSPEVYRDQLIEVFARIAGHRPLKLVH